MAVITVDYTTTFFGFTPRTVRPGTTFMGRDIPPNVVHIDTAYATHNNATLVRWTNKDGSTHDMEFLHPLVPEYITALLVSMRLSC
jgi:hypothetical protein